MKINKRDIVKCVVLSLITCGIYGIYWTICIAREGVSVKDPSDDGMLELILSLVLMPVGTFLIEKKITEGCQAKGIEHKDNTLLYLVLGFVGFGIVSMCMIQNDLNNIADRIV